jgi:uncharacterized membrane protein
MKINQNVIYASVTFVLLIFILFAFSYQFIHNAAELILIKNFYGKICHQIEIRCFAFNGKPMLICARCTGIFSGMFFLFLILLIFENLRMMIDRINYKRIFIFLLPLLIDWTINFIFKIETTNFVRFLTGFIFSFIPVYFLNSIIINSKYPK